MKLLIQGVHVLYRSIESVQPMPMHDADPKWMVKVRTVSGQGYWEVVADQQAAEKMTHELLRQIVIWHNQ